MKLILVSSVLFLTTGCMTMLRGTPHEYCQKHAESYASYDQCYGEETSKRKSFRESMSQAGDGLQNVHYSEWKK